MKQISNKNIGLLSSALLFSGAAWAQHSPTPAFDGKTGKTPADTKEAFPQRNPKAPAGAPNVVWILIDDIGYGAVSAFGGLIETPNFDRLAGQGLRYTNFHSTAFSAPTRAALLTGRNPHSVHFGFFSEWSYGTPGYDGYLPFEKATIAEILRENGYNTFAVGKYHLTHPADASQAGPFNRWPTGRGFDHYFGYIPNSGMDDSWHPTLYRDTQREPDRPQATIATELFATEALRYIADQKTAAPDKPFFLYFAPGATHYPHQASKEWIDKYKGKFDFGWDKYREIVLKNQIELGVVPAGTQLAPQNPGVKPWDELSADEKKVFARQMEVYAAFAAQTDHEVGRIVDFIEQIGQLDNTLIVLAIGDNGAEGSGRESGHFLPHDPNASREQITAEEVKQLDLLGSEYSFAHYPDGWAAATNTPFRFYKGYPDYEGGTHNPLILFYPKKIKEQGGIRHQYSYISDILPTTVELAGLKTPSVINGYPQEPVEGVSLAYSVAPENSSLPERHSVQYHEMTGAYAIYKDGWKASFPGGRYGYRQRGEPDGAKYHLYHVSEDFNETNDLADRYPEKVRELAELFEAEAWKYNVFPLKDRWVNANQFIFDGRKQLVLYLEGRSHAEVLGFQFVNSASYAITAEAEIPPTGAEGVLLSLGNASAGISFYVKNQKLTFVYNTAGKQVEVRSDRAVPHGKVTFRADVSSTGGESDIRKNKTVTLSINGEKAVTKELGAQLPIMNPLPWIVIQAGRDFGTPVSTAYKSPFTFTGKLEKVTIDTL
ncbi:MAG: arylsulfatase [Tannerella sp.]|jgi:arylsulfatase|nr:arylsulfatase [Tannerella sp.]